MYPLTQANILRSLSLSFLNSFPSHSISLSFSFSHWYPLGFSFYTHILYFSLFFFYLSTHFLFFRFFFVFLFLYTSKNTFISFCFSMSFPFFSVFFFVQTHILSPPPPEAQHVFFSIFFFRFIFASHCSCFSLIIPFWTTSFPCSHPIIHLSVFCFLCFSHLPSKNKVSFSISCSYMSMNKKDVWRWAIRWILIWNLHGSYLTYVTNVRHCCKKKRLCRKINLTKIPILIIIRPPICWYTRTLSNIYTFAAPVGRMGGLLNAPAVSLAVVKRT